MLAFSADADNSELANVTGALDANLRQIETELEVAISRRGHQFRIEGPPRPAQQAVDVLKKNIALQPFSPYGYYQLGMTYHHLGESAEAWRIHDKLKGFEPRYAATLKRDIENTPRQQSAAPDSSTRSESDNREASALTQ